jgi:hypothetical protein
VRLADIGIDLMPESTEPPAARAPHRPATAQVN